MYNDGFGMKVKLYSYWRSSSSYRVRCALNLKGIEYDILPVHLVKDGGEHRTENFQSLNPKMEVPVLEMDGLILTQSMAMMDFLESRYEDPKLFPESPTLRAKAIELCEIINSGIHPLQNLGTLKALEAFYQVDRGQWPDWIRHWISLGFKALEVQLAKRTDPFSFGKRPGVLECYLVPQVYNANRYELDMSLFPRIQNIYDRCMQLEPFQLAAPDAQPDAE